MGRVRQVSVLFVLCLVAHQAIGMSSGSCKAARLCCHGRDSSCIVNGVGHGRGRPCFCDEGCLETRDCCSDYTETCSVQVQDCEVSDWSFWSSCDTSCGVGTQHRTRVVVVQPSPTGKTCGPLKQSRTCMGKRCNPRYWSDKHAIRETAGLLPAKYFHKMKGARNQWDVRENLFRHAKMIKEKQNQDNPMSNSIEDYSMAGYQADQPTGASDYCIVFEVSKVTKACAEDKDFKEIQSGLQMCALCPEDARRETLGDRCKGHGVDSRLTRWRSTVNPKCRGKWRRIYEMRDCPCRKGPDFIFV